MNGFTIKTGRDAMQLSRVKELIDQTYWAKGRSIEVIEKSMQHSLCYGVFSAENDRQVGFARAITDYATFYYICDVIVDEEYRGCGIGKALMNRIAQSEELVGLGGVLATKDAHELYRKYGFQDGTNFMRKPAQQQTAE